MRDLLKTALPGILLLVAIVAVPIVLRPKQQKGENIATAEKIVIITPHTESIRYEFETAFKKYYLAKRGKSIEIDWRMPGGTSDIVRYIDDRFTAAFKKFWEANPELGKWSEIVANNFNNHKLDTQTENVDEIALKARKIFLESNVGIGIDLFFGGGQYEMERQARKGYAVDAGLLKEMPEIFNEGIIPQKFSGEIFYDPKGRYYGTCLSSFGIAYNIECLRLLGIREVRRWDDLARPEFFGTIALADPTKSGSINKCFEMILQQTMAEEIEKKGRNEKTLEEGWRKGLNIIKRMGANSRYITDSASKVPRDVAKGDTAAGICIDFYGRTEAEFSTQSSNGIERMKFVMPEGGSSISADPILLFRGAPNREAAIEFIKFVLSKEGQCLWNQKPGTPNGPVKYALRRLPIRKDLYADEYRKYMSDPDATPYQPEKEFNYDPSLTARHFTLIRIIIKLMIIDPLPELQKAWKAIIESGGEEKCKHAVEEFDKLPFSYAEADRISNELNPTAQGNTPLNALRKQRQISEFFRTQYLKAAALAQQGAEKNTTCRGEK